MSYLTNDSILGSFSQCIISFWFRVPQGSLDAAKAASGGGGDDPPPLDGIVPLMVIGPVGHQGSYLDNPSQTLATQFTPTGNQTFGSIVPIITSEQTGPLSRHWKETLHTQQVPTGSGAVERSYTRIASPSAGPETPTKPTFIGIDASDPTQPTLYINFESNQVGSGTGYLFLITSVTPAIGSGSPCGFFGYSGSATVEWDQLGVANFQNPTHSGELTPQYGSCISITDSEFKEHYSDESSFALARTAAIFTNQIAVTADEWHHVLISLDFNTNATHGGNPNDNLISFIDAYSSIFVALDDKDYVRDDLGAIEGTLNGFICDDAQSVAGTSPDPESGGEVAQYSTLGLTVPAGDAQFGIPGREDTEGQIFEVEMAEFQMWTDQKIDTSDVDMRRLFIDDGGRPVHVEKAAKTLGQPDILLHRASNWRRGVNRGGAGYDPTTNTLIPAGQFTPTGKNIKYTPDPSLHGPQGE